MAGPNKESCSHLGLTPAAALPTATHIASARFRPLTQAGAEPRAGTADDIPRRTEVVWTGTPSYSGLGSSLVQILGPPANRN